MNRHQAAIGILSGLAALSASGAEPAPAVVGEEMVVTPSRDARPAYTIPANTTVLTADDIRRAGYSSASDALANLGGVTVRSITGNPATAEVSMRGFGENSHGRVLVLLDGRRLNRPDMATINWLQIPVNRIERIEVVRGGGSVLYGDNAVAGVVNIITRQGDKEPAASVSGEVGSYGLNAVRAGADGSGAGLSYAVNAERQETGGYRDRTGFRSWGAGGALGYDGGESLKLSASLSYQNVYYEIPGWLSRVQMREDRRQSLNPDDSAENEYWSATVGFAFQPAAGQSADAGLYFGRTDRRSDMTSWLSFADQTIDTIGVTPRYVLESDWAGHRNRLVAGLDWYRDQLDLDRASDASHDDVTSSACVTRDTLGVYLRDEFGLTDAWTLGAGARVESATIEASMDSAGAPVFDDRTTHHTSAMDASLIRTFENRSKVFGRFGTVYRYPFVDEQVSYVGFGADGFNANLDPERGWSAEAGAEVRPFDAVRAGVTLFWMEMQDEIAWDPLAAENRNLDETRHQGLETEVSWTPVERVRFTGNYTYTEATFREGANKGNDIPLVPQQKATVGVTARLPWQTSAGIAATYVGPCRLGGDNGNIAEKLDDYVVTDLMLRYGPAAVPGLEAFFAVDNLFDARYAPLGYVGWFENGYYPAAGRGCRGGLSYRF